MHFLSLADIEFSECYFLHSCGSEAERLASVFSQWGSFNKQTNNKTRSPDLHSGDVAHALQQGPLAQPPRDVAAKLRLRLRRQAAVHQAQAVLEAGGTQRYYVTMLLCLWQANAW